MQPVDSLKFDQHAIAQQLTLMQLGDSFFPSGSYTLSHGLESLVQAQKVSTPEEVEMFAQLLLCNKIGPTDVVALLHSHRASAANQLSKLREIEARLFAQTPIEKTRTMQRQSGRALLMVAYQTWPHSQLADLQQLSAQNKFYCLHPIVFATVAQVAGLNEQSAVVAFVHGFVTGLLGAAIRLGVLGHSQAQIIRQRLNDDMQRICQQARTTDLEDMWSCAPLLDWAQMRQAQLSRRLFAS